MQVKKLIEKLNELPQDMEIYTGDYKYETGGCIEFNIDPSVVKLVICQSNIKSYDPNDLATYIDKAEYHKNDIAVVKEFEGVLFDI